MLARLDDADTDAGPRNAAAGTARLCVVTREVKPTEELIRFVVGPDQAVVADLKRKLPGRGAGVPARRDVLATAVKRGAFARAFRADVKAAPDLPATVEHLMERALLDALAIARKARQVVVGHAQVEAAAEQGAALAVLHASDARPDGVRQISAAIRRGSAPDDAAMSWLFRCLRPHNWIWHLPVQMWYMLRCLPAEPAKPSWRGGKSSPVSGRPSRAVRTQFNRNERPRVRDWND